MNIGFVIVNYNDYKTTTKLINNIKNYKCLNKIVIVDNNSTDDSYKKLKKLENKKISVIKNDSNSYASGLNFGAKYLIDNIGECNIIFSNSDIIVKDEKDIIELSNTTKKHSIGVVGPVVNQHGIYSKGWPVPTANKEILFNLPYISRYFRKEFLNYNESHYDEDISIVGAVSGCFFLVNSKVLEEVNYFDTNTFLYYEENILAKKIEKTNYQIAINNKVEVIHDHSVSIDKSVTSVNKYKILKESQHYFVKNYLNANKLQLLLLWMTNKLSLLILKLRVIIK